MKDSFGDAFPITPSDSAGLPVQVSGIYVGGTGNAKVVTQSGNEVALNGLPAGAVVELEIVKVLSTGTTATSIVGLTRAPIRAGLLPVAATAGAELVIGSGDKVLSAAGETIFASPAF